MLYITEHHGTASSESTWHINEPMPYISPKSRVITFQADGDELEVIINALRAASIKES